MRTSSAANVGEGRDSERRQREAIEAFARHSGHVVVEWFNDPAVSGADAVPRTRSPVVPAAGFRFSESSANCEVRDVTPPYRSAPAAVLNCAPVRSREVILSARLGLALQKANL